MKSLPFFILEAWKRYPFRAEPPHIGHYREYPRDEVRLLVCMQITCCWWRDLINVPLSWAPQFDTTLRNKGYNLRLGTRRYINDHVKYVTISRMCRSITISVLDTLVRIWRIKAKSENSDKKAHSSLRILNPPLAHNHNSLGHITAHPKSSHSRVTTFLAHSSAHPKSSIRA